MNENVKRTFDLTAEQSSFVDRLVSEGRYRSPDDVVRAAIDELEIGSADIEDWLRRDVARAHNRLRQNPSSALSSEQVLERLELPTQTADKAARST